MQRARTLINAGRPLPFSIYSSKREQHLLNVPIHKPLLVCVATGNKHLGNDGERVCRAGHFVFLATQAGINMRNIPGDIEYCALLIEFDVDDFACLSPSDIEPKKLKNSSDKTLPVTGPLSDLMSLALEQFVHWSAIAPETLWSARRQELLKLLLLEGHKGLSELAGEARLSQRLYALIEADLSSDDTAQVFARKLAMSEASLRRRLKAEGTGIQQLKDAARLGRALHLLQSSDLSVAAVAEQCAYQSPSRFTDKFKQRFGLTPSELRKTRSA